MPARKGLLAPQNTFLDTIATRFDGTHSNFVLGNAKITRIYPIVYCSDGFCELTGYSRAQIMQKSCACNFLYGQKTDVQHRDAISKSLERKQELKLEVILYKSSGTPFWCLLDIVPIQDEKHEVVLFLCSHKDITKQKLHEQQQRIALHHQMHLQQAAAAAAIASADQQLANQQQHQHQNQHIQAQDNKTQHNSGSTNTNNNDHPICMANASGELYDKRNRKLDDQVDEQQRAGSMSPSSQMQQQQQQRFKDESKDQESSGQVAQSQLQQLQQQQEHDDQQALISMEEFCIDDMEDDENELDGDQDDEHHDKHTTNQYSRRRSRAVLYQLSGHYGYRRSVNMKSKLKLNNRMTIPEYKTTTIEKQKFILSHYGLGKSCWDWLILVVSFYVAIVVPYNATFKESRSRVFEGNHHFGGHKNQSAQSGEHEQRDGTQFAPTSSYSSKKFYNDQVCEIDSIDIFVEVVFIIDVILNFRTTFVNRKGEVVTRPKIICRHYFRGWFVVDACAAMPFDLLCGLNLLSRSLSNIDLNLLKLIRLLRLARLLQKMDRYSQYSYIILTLLMLIFSLLAHWCACIWYVIAMEEIGRHPPEWKLGWIHQLSDKLGYNVVNVTDMASSYVTALYFTTSSLTSVGFGNVSANTNAEKIFSIVIMLIGALMHAVVFGNVTALIRVMYARRSNYQTRLRDLKDFFRLHQLPKELQQRMIDYFQTTWSLNHGIDTAEILKDFPGELCGDVSLHLHREVLSLPIFENAPQGFLKSLARHIESKFCCPTEYLIHRGDALGYLYLVCNGSMEVLQDNMVVGILGKGDLVGYDVNATLTSDQQQASGAGGQNNSNIMQHGPLAAGSGNQVNKIGQSMSPLVKSSSDLKALTYCDLKCIHIGGLLEVLKLYPEFADTFHDEIIHDLSFNLREQHEEHDLIEAPAGDEDDDENEERDDDDEEEEEEEEDEEGGDEDDNVDDDDDDNDDGGGGVDGGHKDQNDRPDTNQQDDHDANNGPDDASSPPPSSPPPPPLTSQALRSPPIDSTSNYDQMGRLLRSITQSGHQSGHIGRYDYNDEDAEMVADNIAAVDEHDDDDDDDDGDGDGDGDEEAGEEDEEEFRDLNRGRADLNPRRDNQESSDDSGGQLPVLSANRENSAGVRTYRRATNMGSKNLSTGGKIGCDGQQKRVRKQTIESASLDGQNDSEPVCELVDQCDTTSLMNDLGQNLIGRFGGSKMSSRLAKRVRDNDWGHFSHSYDGLVSSPGHQPMGERTIDTPGSNQQQRPQRTMATREVAKLRNRSDEIVLELAQLHRTSSAQPTELVGDLNGISGAGGQRLKSAIGVQGQMRANKPPISFDLSRNTTAIINRRRRSAGCIQKPNVIGTAPNNNNTGRAMAGRVVSSDQSNGAQPIGDGKRCHSSSLININENEPMTMRQQMGAMVAARNGQSVIQMEANSNQRVGGRRRSLERSSLVQQYSQQNSKLSPGSNKTTNMKASYSNQDLQQIDAHITASVRKLRQEFRQEINRAIESLAQMVLERDSIGMMAANSMQSHPSNQQQANKRLGRQGGSIEVPARPMQRRGPTLADGQALQRRCTENELSAAKREEAKEATVSRSISSSSFNGVGLSQTTRLIMTKQQQAKIMASATVELQHNSQMVSNQEINTGQWSNIAMASAKAESGALAAMMVDKILTSSLELAPADSCPAGLVQQQQSSGQEQRPASDSSQQQHQQRQSSLMLNASDNDSGRSTCSVNSSAAAFAGSSRSPITTSQVEPESLSQSTVLSKANCSSAQLVSAKFDHRVGASSGAVKTMLVTNDVPKRPMPSDEFTNCTSHTINVSQRKSPSERCTEL